MSDEKKLITININGKDCEVPAGMNVVDAAASHGVEIPHYCYHPHLSVAGNCRMCLVELGMPMRDRGTGEPILDDDGKQKIGFMPKPAIACSTNAAPGMHIKTNSDAIKDCRNGVMEFLLVNHPLDCPICDQAGECRLQEFSTDYGRGYSRFVEDKNVKPKRTRLGPRVILDDERCILCSRCIRFSQEVANDDVLGFIDRGSYSTLTCYPGKELANNYSLNTVDICPVGALTSTDFRFKMRVWFLKPVNSICAESSVGVNTQVWVREGKIYRITPRRNDAVNDSWMSDSGRALYNIVDTGDRLAAYTVDGAPKSLEDAASAGSSLLAKGKTAIVASGHQSLEEQFILSSIAKETEAKVFMVAHSGEGDGMLISEDRSPNVRGALVVGLTDVLPQARLEKLSSLIDSGDVTSLILYGEDATKLGLSTEQLKKVKLIYIGTHANSSSERADVVLPGITVFGKSGTFINQQFRIQKFDAALPAMKGVVPDFHALFVLLDKLKGADQKVPTISNLWDVISKEVDVLKDVHIDSLSDEGKQLNGSDWNELSFPEGKSLHYEPAGETAGAIES